MKIINKIRRWLDNVGSYRMTTDTSTYQHPAFIVEVQGLFSWHIVKTFISDDAVYAKNCAMELLEMLEDEIEPKQRN